MTSVLRGPPKRIEADIDGNYLDLTGFKTEHEPVFAWFRKDDSDPVPWFEPRNPQANPDYERKKINEYSWLTLRSNDIIDSDTVENIRIYIEGEPILSINDLEMLEQHINNNGYEVRYAVKGDFMVLNDCR